LERLDLSYNNVSTLGGGLLNHLRSLKWLNLFRAGPLPRINSHTFTNLTALTELDLGETGITSLEDGVFDGLTSLKKLCVEGGEAVAEIVLPRVPPP